MIEQYINEKLISEICNLLKIDISNYYVNENDVDKSLFFIKKARDFYTRNKSDCTDAEQLLFTEKSIINYIKAIKFDPTNDNSWNDLGVVFDDQDMYDYKDLLILLYQKSLECFPNGYIALLNLAVMSRADGDMDKAQTLYEQSKNNAEQYKTYYPDNQSLHKIIDNTFKKYHGFFINF